MATVLQKLKEEGWFISDEGLKKLNENGAIGDVKELTKRAKDHDLRELVTVGGLPNDIAKSSKVELPPSGVVLQIVNIRNVSAPKSNQESKTSPRLLQIDMTDGQTFCSGLDLEHLSAFSINTAPGTKVLLRNTVKLVQGFLSLAPQNISILGGQVQALYEKWEAHRNSVKYSGVGGRISKKSAAETLKGSPPPWISFGNKIKGTTDDANFKSLDVNKPKEVSKEESEFLAMRNAAIAEAATKGEVKKQFGGSNRQLMDHNVKKILDKGYTEEQAKLALKIARNNLERAMNHLKKRTATNEPFDRRQKSSTDMHMSRRGGKSSDEPPPAKPSGKVSLFDFLSDKIPDVEPATKPNVRSQSSNDHVNKGQRDAPRNMPKFENNISSSFASRQKKDDSQPRSRWNENNSSDKHNKPFQQNQGSHHPQQPYKTSQSNMQSYQNQNHPQTNGKSARFSANNQPADAHTQYSDMNNKRNERKGAANSSAPSSAKAKTNIKSVIEATGNLQISDNKPHQRQKNQGPPAQQQRNANFEEAFPQAKRYPYDPYKIMGFQNKETNEFAMNVLKMGEQTVATGGNNNDPNSMYSNLNNTANIQPKHAHMPSHQQMPIVPVQQNIPPPKANYINPNIASYNMPTMQQQPFLWSFKVGDRCLAKYWEDEKYYNAKIEAVGDKTCVVHFLEYGNTEEVLHVDCLPITDNNHQPINQYSTMQAPPPIAYTQMPAHKAGPPPHFHHSFHSQPAQPPHHSAVMHGTIPGQPNNHQARQPSIRQNNRQVYVPPAQRK